jgi:hypothetical protein
MELSQGEQESSGAAAVQRAFFDVYGYRFELRSTCPSAFDGLCQDFAFFHSDARGAERVVEVCFEDPQYDGLPACDAAIHTPRNIVYKTATDSFIDYQGRGIARHDRQSGSFRIQGLDEDILYEAAYLFLLSQCGEFLDRRGKHRVHALGVVIQGKAVVVLLPMGGGKSTLAYDLLKHPKVKLLSDDSPLVDRAGNLFAYPLRIGLLPGAEGEVPEQHRRVIQRMGFGPKVSVSYEYFADRVVAGAEPGIVFLGTRRLSNDCRIERAGLTMGLRRLLADCVVGLGLFQGVEFVLNRKLSELLPLAGVASSRLWSSWRLLRRSRVYRLGLGRDRELNARTVVAECERLLGMSTSMETARVRAGS